MTHTDSAFYTHDNLTQPKTIVETRVHQPVPLSLRDYMQTNVPWYHKTKCMITYRL